jgi:hypothetical protein
MSSRRSWLAGGAPSDGELNKLADDTLVKEGNLCHYSKRTNFRRPKLSDINLKPSDLSYVRRYLLMSDGF